MNYNQYPRHGFFQTVPQTHLKLNPRKCILLPTRAKSATRLRKREKSKSLRCTLVLAVIFRAVERIQYAYDGAQIFGYSQSFNFNERMSLTAR